MTVSLLKQATFFTVLPVPYIKGSCCQEDHGRMMIISKAKSWHCTYRCETVLTV